MNQDQIKGNWKQFTGKVKQTWSKLTDDDIALLDGKREEFLGKLQERQGLAKEEAEKQLRHIEESYKDLHDKAA